MAKFCGAIGFAESVETSPDVWEDAIVERKYYGEITRNFIHNKSADKLNDDVEIQNAISILSDAYANDNLSKIRYVVLRGAKWKINNVEIQYPRLILSVGGVYNA